MVGTASIAEARRNVDGLQFKVDWSGCPNLLISLYRWLWHSRGATGGHHLVSAPNSRQARKSTTDSSLVCD